MLTLDTDMDHGLTQRPAATAGISSHRPRTPGRLAQVIRRLCAPLAAVTITVVSLCTSASSSADPPDINFTPDPNLIRPLPVITPGPSNWVPKFPFPFDQTRDKVTDADINGEREMCQWFNAQYDTIRRQIDRLQSDRITQNGPGVISGAGSDWDYSINGLQQQADIVTTNIDQAVDFLAPRVQALTQSTDLAGDTNFPLYEGESFYLLWQHLSNVDNGIKAHQPDWFTGPSMLRVKRWGTRINRSHVCD